MIPTDPSDPAVLARRWFTVEVVARMGAWIGLQSSWYGVEVHIHSWSLLVDIGWELFGMEDLVSLRWNRFDLVGLMKCRYPVLHRWYASNCVW